MLEAGYNIKSLAEELDCSIHAVRKWIRKERTPRPPMQAKIRDLTKGKVGGESWVPPSAIP